MSNCKFKRLNGKNVLKLFFTETNKVVELLHYKWKRVTKVLIKNQLQCL